MLEVALAVFLVLTAGWAVMLAGLYLHTERQVQKLRRQLWERENVPSQKPRKLREVSLADPLSSTGQPAKLWGSSGGQRSAGVRRGQYLRDPATGEAPNPHSVWPDEPA